MIIKEKNWLIHSIETYELGRNEEICHTKEEIKRNNIKKQYKIY